MKKAEASEGEDRGAPKKTGRGEAGMRREEGYAGRMGGNIGVRDSVGEGGLEGALREGMPGRGKGRRGIGELFICFLSGLPRPAPPLSPLLGPELMLKGGEVAAVCLCEWGSRRLPADQPPGLSSHSFPAPSGEGSG